jgi:CBS domain-containing protein
VIEAAEPREIVALTEIGKGRSKTMVIRRTARKALVTAQPETTAQGLAAVMRNRHVGAVVITEKGRPVGIVTDRDLVSRAMAAGRDARRVRARDIMTRKVVTAREETPLAKVTEQMRARGVRRIPVVDGNGRLVNILTLDDMLVVLGDEIANLGRAILVGMGRESRPAARRRGRSRRR